MSVNVLFGVMLNKFTEIPILDIVDCLCSPTPCCIQYCMFVICRFTTVNAGVDVT